MGNAQAQPEISVAGEIAVHHLLSRLPTRANLSGHDIRTLGSGVSESADYCRLRESSGSKLTEEGISFLCSCDSRKPIGIGLTNVGRKVSRQD
jgi:hypothetical protein